VLDVLAQFLDPKEGPQPTGDFQLSPTPLIAMVLLGFVVGAFGHLYKSRTIVAIGVLLILLGTVLLPLFYALTR